MDGEISHYRILAPLGQGAMGEVYRAVDQRLGREVALKMLPREVESDPDWQTRLMREAQAASALNHPGIVTLYDIESDRGRSFLVMELVVGDRMSNLARRGVPWRRACDLAAGVADALAAAHALGILHRDIKTDNLMVSTSGQVKVLDFGLAKLRADAVRMSTQMAAVMPDDIAESVELAETIVPSGSQPSWRPKRELSSDLTQAGQLVGTPAYMAPECFDGAADVRSEVFALGIVLYELLVGRRPFDRGNALATMGAIRLDDPEPPSKAAPDRRIPARVDRVVARALAKRPEDRFPDMASLAAALRAAAHPGRRPVTRWVVGVALLAAAGGAVAAWRLTRRHGAAPVAMEVGASRRLTLDTGCEEYPQFSGDGNTIYYDGLAAGDYEIQRIGVDGAGRRRLTHSPGWDYAAAVSPDGGRIAFVHEATDRRTVQVMPADGGAAVDLGPISGYPAWTDDGALLVGDDAGRVLRWDLGGGRARETVLGQLPAGARPYHLGMVDGAGVVVLWWTSSDADATALGELDRDGNLRVIEESLSDYEGGLAISHTRRGYYFTRKGATTGNQLLWRRWGGGDAQVVPGGLSPRAGIDVSRDGSRLVFSTCEERQYLARLRPGQPPVVLSRGDWQDSAPLALDRGRLLITSDRRGTRQGWTFDLVTHEAAPVTPANAHGASPSRDGRLVVYAAEAGRGGLAVVAIAGGPPRQLTRDPSDAAAAFTRDGAAVVFQRSPAGETPRIYLVPTGGGPERMLATGVSPAASPVDDTIAFVSAADAGGARLVMLTDTSGAPPRAVPGVAAGGWFQPRFSADGGRLLLLSGYQEVVEVTLDGSAPPRVLWTAGTDGVLAADYAPDGDGVVAALGDYDGDLWLAEGRFP